MIPIPADSGTTAPRADRKISLGDGIDLSDLYKPGKNQVVKRRTVPLRVPQARSQRAFYDEVTIGGHQSIVFHNIFIHSLIHVSVDR